jgi:type IV pilus assembly protein PilB
MDFRVSVLPTLFGREDRVLRLLDKGNLQLDMTKLGLERSSWPSSSAHRGARTAWCGHRPTGSGKTTRCTRHCRS